MAVTKTNNLRQGSKGTDVSEVQKLLNANGYTLDVDGSCFFFGSHPYNLVPVSGYMSQRDEMIAALREGIKEYDDEFLDSVWFRGGI